MPFLLMPDTCQRGRSWHVQLSRTTEAGGLHGVRTAWTGVPSQHRQLVHRTEAARVRSDGIKFTIPIGFIFSYQHFRDHFYYKLLTAVISVVISLPNTTFMCCVCKCAWMSVRSREGLSFILLLFNCWQAPWQPTPISMTTHTCWVGANQGSTHGCWRRSTRGNYNLCIGA